MYKNAKSMKKSIRTRRSIRGGENPNDSLKRNSKKSEINK